MGLYTLSFREIDNTTRALAGGKGANLGELSRIEEISVPEGFCITAKAYKRIIDEIPALNDLLDQLSLLSADEIERIAYTCGEIRSLIDGTPIPEDIREEVARSLSMLGGIVACAVRSSATAEDLPSASFAGQHDTFLNVVGFDEILKHVSKCWASLFTERAAAYRIRNGFDHRKVQLSVIVQKMISPYASGIAFTADPITANRKVTSIDASYGLGEALVAGVVNADNYRIREGKIIEKRISSKKLAIYPSTDGGTDKIDLEAELRDSPALTDEQILELERISRKIESHFGSPQDIEWCLAEGKFYIVQSRPITTLFPIPEADDEDYRVYISVGHQQMMTDAMKPLGLSFFLLTTPAKMRVAAGRLFVDITQSLASLEKRAVLLDSKGPFLGQHDPLLLDALLTIIERGDFDDATTDERPVERQDIKSRNSPNEEPVPKTDLSPSLPSELIARMQESLVELKSDIHTKSGVELFDFIQDDIGLFKQNIFDKRNMEAIMAGINASAWINEKMFEWLGEKNAADALAQSAPNNVTSEMGLALLDVADAIRPYQEVIEFLQRFKDEDYLDELVKLQGGKESRVAILAFLDKYGMRCPGEIDITRPRWSEKPSALIPLILNNIKNFEPGESMRKRERGLQEARQKEVELLNRLKSLPDGAEKAAETKRNIDLIRNFSGYREYPKYGIVNRYFVYKQALLSEAERLRQAGVIQEIEDIYYLTFEELREVVRTNKLDSALVEKRKEEFESFKKLTPPRVITSDGEIVTGKYRRENIPTDALVGLPVSAGTVEGRARVVLNMESADIKEGDILVTIFTDPSWTPLFLSIKGLVTEVGGLMTHGAVIAREYGLPAVTGVENATALIKDGDRIRLNGAGGYIEKLESKE